MPLRQPQGSRRRPSGGRLTCAPRPWLRRRRNHRAPAKQTITSQQHLEEKAEMEMQQFLHQTYKSVVNANSAPHMVVLPRRARRQPDLSAMTATRPSMTRTAGATVSSTAPSRRRTDLIHQDANTSTGNVTFRRMNMSGRAAVGTAGLSRRKIRSITRKGVPSNFAVTCMNCKELLRSNPDNCQQCHFHQKMRKCLCLINFGGSLCTSCSIAMQFSKARWTTNWEHV